jgi:hypothetical protein
MPDILYRFTSGLPESADQAVSPMRSPPGIPATVNDPDGRIVELTRERWLHIVTGHPELVRYRAQVLLAVRAPDRRLRGRWPDE